MLKIIVPKSSHGVLYDKDGKDEDEYESSYRKALDHLIANLQDLAEANKDKPEKKVEKTKILSLGRKGGKLIECLLQFNDEKVYDTADKRKERDEDLRNLDIVSEHALPFISKHDRNKNVVYCLMDDGLYYGSSARWVAKEVYAFENIYQITGHKDKKIDYFSVIDTGGLRPDFNQYIGKVNALSTKDGGLDQSYSHFFAKRLSRDIRSLENTFEIEFPVVTYDLDRRIDEREWEEMLEQAFQGTYSRVYAVVHAENYSVNVLLPNTGGSSFNKIQMYPSNSTKERGRNNRLKVVVMAPRPIQDDDYDLKHFFDHAGEGYRELWKQIYDRCGITTSDTNPQNILDYYRVGRRRSNKSLVIMANYLLSFSTLVQQRSRLEEFFGRVGVKANFRKKDIEKDLYHLLGDRELCIDIARQLSDFYYQGTVCGDVNVDKDFSTNYMVFENSKNIDEDTLVQIRMLDKYMVSFSQNVEEALCALLFNQDMFFEKYVLTSNPLNRDFNRLRIGYTFDLLQSILEYAVKWYGLKLGQGEDLVTTLHRWVDRRIGEASIVPQYILDEKSGRWIRGFRHGENEETLLSHLARFFIMMHKEWKAVTGVEWISREDYQDLLVAVYEKIEGRMQQIVESQNIHFSVDETNRQFVFVNDDYEGDDEVGKPRSALDYMIEMCILLEKDNGRVYLDKRINFFLQPGITTMEKQTEEDVKGVVREKAGDFREKHKKK